MAPMRSSLKVHAPVLFLLAAVTPVLLTNPVVSSLGQALGSAYGLPSSDRVLGPRGGLAEAVTLTPSYNSTPCELFASMYGGSGIQYYSNFTIMFSQLCQTPQFVSIYDEMGPSGVFVVGWGGPIGAVPNLSFSLYWEASCTNASDGLGSTQCTHQADWLGTLTNNTVTGPFLREYAIICMCGPVLLADPPPSGSSPWLLFAVIGIGVAIGGVLTVVTARRRGLPPKPPEPNQSPIGATDGRR